MRCVPGSSSASAPATGLPGRSWVPPVQFDCRRRPSSTRASAAAPAGVLRTVPWLQPSSSAMAASSNPREVPQHDDGALVRRQDGQGAADLIAVDDPVGRVGPPVRPTRVRVHRPSPDSARPPALIEVGVGENPPDIGLRVFDPGDPAPASVGLQQRGLHQVLGRGGLTGQHIGIPLELAAVVGDEPVEVQPGGVIAASYPSQRAARPAFVEGRTAPATPRMPCGRRLPPSSRPPGRRPWPRSVARGSPG